MAGKRIMVIDDDALIRLQVCDAIRAMHPDVELMEAADGELALARLDTFAADLVLLDLFMPNLSGVETLSFIRLRPNPPKVVIMSSLDSESMKADLLGQGAAGFIGKPFHPLELAETINRNL
ncbi:MAG: response regulator transcription factor [Myxococcaceae bacterium]|nr:response regulator transcription factor [Myxococcaceae bacterium]